MNRRDENGQRITGVVVRRTWPDGRTEAVWRGAYHVNEYATALMVAQKIRDDGGAATVERTYERSTR